MEFPVQTDSLPASYWERHKSLFLITLLTGALATACIAYLYFEGGRNSIATTTLDPSLNANFVFSAGMLDIADMYVLSQGTSTATTFEPINKNNGSSVAPIDAVQMSDKTWYYILADSIDPIVANVYKKTPEGTLTKLTSSQTMKYRLHVSKNGSLLYQSRTVKSIQDLIDKKTWDIVYVENSKKTEKVLAKGTMPSFAQGELAVVYLAGKSLRLLRLTDGVDVVHMTAPPTYTLNKSGDTLALYNIITGKADIYSLKQDFTFSYIESVTLPARVTALSFNGDDLVTASVHTKNLDSFTLKITNTRTQKDRDALVHSKAQNVVVEKITTYE